MKCKHCDGTGTTNWCVNGTFVDCPYCGGTGEIEVELTNEERFCQLPTEQKAKFLKEISFCCNTCSPEQFEAYKNGMFKCPLKMACATANGFEDWLKEKHNG